MAVPWRRVGLRAALAMLAASAASIATGASGRSETTLTCASPLARITVREAGAALRVDPGVALQSPVLLEVEEGGQPIEFESSTPTRVMAVPPRLGVVVLNAPGAFELRLRLPSGRSVATATARLECDAEKGARAWAWWGRASALAAMLTRGVGSTSFAEAAPQLEALDTTAHDERSRAWAVHLRAQALLTSANARDAAAEFRVAESGWRALGDEARATAARVAAVEDMNRAGAYAQVLELASQSATPAKADYYEVRLQNARCLALRYLGRLDEAGECYSITTRRLLELGESLELAVTSLDFGTIELDRGNLDSAIDLFQRSLALAEGPKVDDERGRAEFYLADAALRTGRPADSIAHLHRAMSHFERSGSGRWLGSSLLRLGGILGELGATVDARIAVDQGLQHFDEKHAPARIAAGRLALARIALRGSRPDQALVYADQARALYAQLSMPIETAAVDDLRLRILVESNDWTAARALAPEIERRGAVSPAAQIALADLDLAGGALAAAEGRLAPIETAMLSLSDRWRFQRSQASLLSARGQSDAALESLRLAGDEWRHIAARARSPLLRERLVGFATNLSAMAVDLLAAQGMRGEVEGDVVGLQDVLAWLPLPPAPGVDAAGEPAAGRDALDRQIAASLFPGAGAGSSSRSVAQRALLEAFVASPATAARVGQARLPRMAVSDLEALLTGEDVAWAVLDGERHALVVRLSVGGGTIHFVTDRTALRRDVAALNALVRIPDSSIADIRGAADRVAERLFVDAAPVASAGRAFVLVTGGLTDIPWPLVLDRMDTSPVDRIVTILVPRGGAEPHAEVTPTSVEVYLAGQRGTAALPPLESARDEAVHIRQALPSAVVTMNVSATRQQVIAGLARSDVWLHFAAHGTSVQGRIGGAGIWLDPVQGDVPDYLSWLEVIDRGTAAPVVVLNACDLAGDDQSDAGFAGFSTALLRSGIQHVVAAYWSASDTASSTWVRAFYSEAAQKNMSIGRAVAGARVALRRSRAFRHPYYWAGLAHLQALVPQEAVTAAR